MAERSVDTAFETGAEKRPTGTLAPVPKEGQLRVSASLRFLGFGLWVGVEQSGVALRFPPHSKSG